MNETFSVITIVALVVVYLPWIASGVISFNPREGGIWRFLAFFLCTLALVGIFFFIVPGVIAWIIAWMCAAASRSAIARSRADERVLTAHERMLQALKEENKLLREHGAAKSAHITESAADFAEGQPEKTVARIGQAELKQAEKLFLIIAGGIIILVFAFLLIVTWPTGPARQVTETPAKAVRPGVTSALFTMRSNTRASGQPHQPAWAYVNSVGECLENCSRYTTCKAFTYRRVSGAVSGACYFYESASFVPDPDFDSGERDVRR
jgi:hypothetical protein